MYELRKYWKRNKHSYVFLLQQSVDSNKKAWQWISNSAIGRPWKKGFLAKARCNLEMGEMEIIIKPLPHTICSLKKKLWFEWSWVLKPDGYWNASPNLCLSYEVYVAKQIPVFQEWWNRHWSCASGGGRIWDEKVYCRMTNYPEFL